MSLEGLFRIRAGNLLTVAGRAFIVHDVQGQGMNKTLVMSTTRLFIGKDGRPTNQLIITIGELLDRLIVIT
jgi:hypothetical protein